MGVQLVNIDGETLTGENKRSKKELKYLYDT